MIAFLLAFSWYFIMIMTAFLVLTAVCNMKFFILAGEAGWKAFIPFYSTIVRSQLVAGSPVLGMVIVGLYVLDYILTAMGVTAADRPLNMATLALGCRLNYLTARSYGCSDTRSIMTIFFGMIPLIKPAFSSSTTYLGPSGSGF